MGKEAAIDSFGRLSFSAAPELRRAYVSLRTGSSDGREPGLDKAHTNPRVVELRARPTNGAYSRLFDYQREVAQKVLKVLLGNRKGGVLVSMPTGAGKTRTGAHIIKSLLENSAVERVIWVAPSIELIEQAATSFGRVWETARHAPSASLHVGGLPHPGKLRGNDVILISTQLAARNARRIAELDPDLIVVDEAHQIAAPTYRSILRPVGGNPRTRRLGFSATPGRTQPREMVDLASLFDGRLIVPTLLGARPIATLRKKGVLAALKWETIPLPEKADNAHLRVTSLHAHSLPVDELCAQPQRFWSTVDALVTAGRQSPTLGFCGSVSHCYALGVAINAAGMKVAVVSYRDSGEKRAQVLHSFREGSMRVLLNATLLATGVDIPKLDSVALTAPVRSPILWEQMMGRAARGPAVGGTESASIIEFDDHRKMHSDVMSYARFWGDQWET